MFLFIFGFIVNIAEIILKLNKTYENLTAKASELSGWGFCKI